MILLPNTISDSNKMRDIVERFKLTFVTVMILMTFGCATQFARDNDILNTYEDHHIDEIVELWGDPIKSFVAPNGNTVYVYYKADIATLKDMVDTSWRIQSFITKVYVCTTYFETSSDGMIVRCSYEGNACK